LYGCTVLKNLDLRKEELKGWVAGFTYDSSKGEGEIYRRFAIDLHKKGRVLSDPAFSD